MGSDFSYESKQPIRSDEELLAILFDASKKLGRVPSQNDLKQVGATVSPQTFANRFGSWNNALRCAGLTPIREWRYSDIEMYESVYQAWVKFGRQPSRTEYSEVCEVSSSAIESRFGSWSAALIKFCAWANEEDVSCKKKSSSKVSRGRRTPRVPSLRLRFKILKEACFTCSGCGCRPPEVELEIDHVVPWSKGGETTYDNLQVLCHRCNSGKSDVY